MIKTKKSAKPLPKNYKWVIFLLATFPCVIVNYNQFQLSPIADDVMRIYDLTTGQYSTVFSSQMIPSVVLALVAGLLVDKFGIKQVLGFGWLVASAGTVLKIFTGSMWSLTLAMIMVGFGNAFANGILSKIFGLWFKPSQINMNMGILLAISYLAMALASGTTALFPSVRFAFTVVMVLMLLVTLLWYLFYKDKDPEPGTETGSPTMRECLRVTLSNRYVWFLSIAVMFTFSVHMTVGSMTPTALAALHDVGKQQAGLYNSVYLIGSLIGCIGAPLLIRLANRMKPVALIMALAGVFSCIGIVVLPAGFLLAADLLIVGICAGGLMTIAFSLPVQIPGIGKIYAGTAGGVATTFQMAGAVIVTSRIVIPIAGENYILMFVLCSVCMAIVFLSSIFLPEIMKHNALDVDTPAALS